MNNSTILSYNEYNPFERNGKKNKVYFREVENIIKKENMNEFSSIISKNKNSINSSCNLNETERRLNKINLISSKLKKYDVPKNLKKIKHLLNWASRFATIQIMIAVQIPIII